MTPTAAAGLAYKAYEIEELIDIYFYRRLGWLVARAAGWLGLSPNAVSVWAGVIGAAGGTMLYAPAWAAAGFVLLVLHGVFDSADGQLARLTGQVSEWGRVLDGVAGYVTHAAMYLAILLGAVDRGASWSLVGVAAAAGVCNAIQAGMYDYHRTAYARVVVSGRVPGGVTTASAAGALRGVVTIYEGVQRWLTGDHARSEALIAARSSDGRVIETDRARYRQAFYRPVLGWNLLGDNMRRYAIGVLVWLQHLEWFFLFILVPMNVVLIGMWVWQRRADRAFVAGSTG